jgi:hypothetical protein
MKLYRGLKNEEYEELNEALFVELGELWKQVLAKREHGDLEYPSHLDDVIKKLFKKQFEITYVVKGVDLFRHAKVWGLEVRNSLK